MFKIRTLDKISSKGLDKMPHDKYEIASEFTDPDAILVRSFKMLDMQFSQSLKAIGRAGAGVNNIPLDKCTEKGIVVFNTPGANANAVKELVLCGLFLSARKIIDGATWIQSLGNTKDDVSKLVEKQKSQYGGTELKGKKLGLIGLGSIGMLVANDAVSLGMEVFGYDPFISVDNAWKLSRDVKKAPGMDYLISNSDYISIHAPLTDSTKGMINKEKFSLMKKGIKIMNFSRAEIVNNKDLKEAIQSGIVSCYVTDFPTNDLVGVENVITIPHLGASTEEAEENCAMMVADQIVNFLEHGNIVNSVNFPDCTLDRSSRTKGERIVIANKNVPAMVQQISTIVAHAGLNITDMINKSRGDIAYNILDIEGDVPAKLVDKLKTIEGIISVRKL